MNTTCIRLGFQPGIHRGSSWTRYWLKLKSSFNWRPEEVTIMVVVRRVITSRWERNRCARPMDA
jgi:hypothetical protein